jgi:hypothetical protein
MKRTCWIHIGMHKTGTTAIQTALDDYDDGRTAYLKLGNANHSHAMMAIFAPALPNLRIGRKVRVSAKARNRHMSSLRSQFLCQVETGGRNLIISGEELTGSLQAPHIGSLITAISPHFDDVRAIAYVREPIGYMRSALQEVVKNGRVTLEPAHPRYKERFEPWMTSLGQNKIELVPYDLSAFPDRNVVADFAARVGLQSVPALRNRKNESLSAEAFALIYSARRKLAALPRGARFQRAELRTYIAAASDFGSTPFALPSSVVAASLDKIREDMIWIEDVMGRSLPAAETGKAGLGFESEDDLFSLVARIEPTFLAWAGRRNGLYRYVRFLVRELRGRI